MTVQERAWQTRVELVCVWVGTAGLVGVFLCLLGAGMLPPRPGPSWSAEHVTEFFAEHRVRVTVFQAVLCFTAMLQVTTHVMISIEMARVEGRWGVLPIAQIVFGACVLPFFLLAAVLWMAVGYRTDVDPSVVRLIDDLAWFALLVPTTPTSLQMIVIGVAGLGNRSENPTFPRWYCFYSIEVGIMILIALFMPLAHGGAFGWSGAIGFWLPVVNIGPWFLITPWLMHKAIRRRQAMA